MRPLTGDTTHLDREAADKVREVLEKFRSEKVMDEETAEQVRVIFEGFNEGLTEGLEKMEEVLAGAVDPAAIPIPAEDLARIKKMNKERRRLWAKSRVMENGKRKRKRKAQRAARRR